MLNVEFSTIVVFGCRKTTIRATEIEIQSNSLVTLRPRVDHDDVVFVV